MSARSGPIQPLQRVVEVFERAVRIENADGDLVRIVYHRFARLFCGHEVRLDRREVRPRMRCPECRGHVDSDEKRAETRAAK